MLTKTDIQHFQATLQAEREDRGKFLDTQRQYLSYRRIQLLQELERIEEQITRIDLEIEHGSDWSGL
jgi:hypothetical protein